MDDLKRKAKTVDESLELSARYILINNDLKSANRLVETFQKRERLQGCVIYDKDGQILAITGRFSDWKQKDKPYLRDILAAKTPRGSLEKFQEYTVYSYILPVLDDEANALGLVEVIYDTSYLFTTLADLWKRISITLIALIILITLIALLIQRQVFILPVRRLTKWFAHFQKGETDKLRPFQEKGEFGNLVSEVEQVALGLRVARKVVTEEAQVRLQEGEVWTEAKLKDLVRAKLGENAFIVVSNREPYMHVIEEPTGKPRCVRPASGVVTAIDPILRACGGTWIAHGSANADRNFVNSKGKLGVPPEDNRYILKRVWLTKEEEEGYYYGFSNEGLWPLCHVTHTRPIFREADWQMYKEVNQKFCQSILEELPANNPFVFIQDYHFTLLPKMIKEKRPDATVALFWHIPWPNPEVFAICPYQQEILDGMLGCDLIGFHVQYHCNNFLDTANRLTECRVDTEKFSVVRNNKETLIRSFPISVDGSASAGASKSEALEMDRVRKEYDLKDKIIGVGVERIDYTKGIIERIMAIDRFLEKYPEYKNKFVFIQLAAPSRTHIKRYHELMGEIDELVEKKNWKYSDGGWKPIIYLKRHFSPEEIRPYYLLADLCIVSSLHDGMNLVAKEYVASRNDSSGALVLSKFTGAARELTDAVMVNPYSIEEFADAIKFTIELPAEEKIKRMENMRKVISENNIYKWAGSIISELAGLSKG
ncbi:MAG: trehalose-6-phosphate synthase [Candidatus Omnitrophica bacterium]|nr:trehalose-6-phosphate synthase [Candidatus Omnitrophota bacterium]MBU1929039.1 trehalose-6-phosphate synthase [Candidatus Omnitrophota bacterium]MBU2035268.1 trehalose-6-phosphate synthase [Candidatus Omnitrophota bacterium]MBU2221268.1 trehalose-6-phosphate synthase [Candidatus Omnitrophota bacterium]MBU2258644.1 trehalose-6-phosphate synthase [Candidatus Omnitrophota bacterium]